MEIHIVQPQIRIAYNVIRYLVLAGNAPATDEDAVAPADKPEKRKRPENIDFWTMLKRQSVNKITWSEKN
jgi:hypothetical protein